MSKAIHEEVQSTRQKMFKFTNFFLLASGASLLDAMASGLRPSAVDVVRVRCWYVKMLVLEDGRSLEPTVGPFRSPSPTKQKQSCHDKVKRQRLTHKDINQGHRRCSKARDPRCWRPKMLDTEDGRSWEPTVGPPRSPSPTKH